MERGCRKRRGLPELELNPLKKLCGAAILAAPHSIFTLSDLEILFCGRPGLRYRFEASMIWAAFLPAATARIRVEAPVTASPPA